jgi:hypothetical protein
MAAAAVAEPARTAAMAMTRVAVRMTAGYPRRDTLQTIIPLAIIL